MSHIQNDKYYEYMHENDICPECQEKISYKTKDMGTTQSEYEIEIGHYPDCIYFETSDRIISEIRAKKNKQFNIKEYLKKIKYSAPKSRKVLMSDGSYIYQEEK